MATGSEVLAMLIPTGGWVISGNDFENIEFIDAKPITKNQFEAGFAQYDSWKAQQDAAKAAAKAAAESKLEALGLSANDLKALGL
jgi:hypothetical protein